MKQYSLNQLAAIYTVYKDLSPTTHTINCCTCGKSIEIKQVEDCYNLFGHFIPRSVNKKLIYYPDNAFAQCSNCNVYQNGNAEIDERYKKYMFYRFGNNIVEKLNKVEQQTKEYYYELYTNLLLQLIPEFPELADVVIDKSTGEVIYAQITYNNSIEQQFNTFSKTYKQDLDTICKVICSEFIEYQRF